MNKSRGDYCMEMIEDKRVGIAALLISIIALFNHYGYSIGRLSSNFYPIVLMFLFSVMTVCLLLIIYGFILKRSWARKFTIMFVCWSLLFPIWGLLVGSQTAEHLLFIALYASILVLLTAPYVKQYFLIIFRFGDWVLFKRDVILKSGKITTIHFFSKKVPKSGIPTVLPYGYEVMISSRSKMPYLRKIGPHPYHFGKYTLYTRFVKLKSGIELPIYFFSKKKPKSGKPVSLPDKYIVRVNQRSNMPYLVRDKPGIH